MSAYTVHLLPPQYPERCFPSRCSHEPQFTMQAEVRIIRPKRGRARLEVHHAVCLACGAPRPATYGGNIFIDLNALWEEFGHNALIGSRILVLRGKWARIASHLFGPEGWNGRHERVARLICPDLVMRLEISAAPWGNGARLAQVRFEPDGAFESSYLSRVAA